MNVIIQSNNSNSFKILVRFDVFELIFTFFFWRVRDVLGLFKVCLCLKLPRRYSDDIISNIANSIFTKVDFQRAVVCLAHYLWSSKLPNAAIAICNFWYRNRRNYRVLVLLPKVGFINHMLQITLITDYEKTFGF